MKTPFFLTFMMLSISLTAFCQTEFDSLDLAFQKTTSLIFKYKISAVDRGSEDVIVQKISNAENALQVKAGKRGFAETNLTVITTDGLVHHFNLNYSDNPSKLVYCFGDEVAFKGNVNEKAIEGYCQRIEYLPSIGNFVKTRKNKMSFLVKGIFISGDLIFYQLQIKNRSHINYDIQSLRFFIADKQKVKRTSSQQLEQEPVYVYNSAERVPGKSEVSLIYVMPKFTIPNAKKLVIEMKEHRGGRNLALQIFNKDIMSARLVPVY